jgi:hypothetical protein
MAGPRTWPPVGDPLGRFGRLQAPALDEPWAGDLLDAIGPRPGDRLLDVACGSGRVGVAVWGPIERSPALAALAGSLERHAGVRVAAAVRWLFSLPEPEELHACLAGAGFGGIRLLTARRTVRFASVGEFLRRYVPGSPVGPATMHMPEDDKRKVVADLEAALAPWVDERGLRVATEVNTAVAER